MNDKLVVVNRYGSPISKAKSVSNLDPNFFLPTPSGYNVSASEIASMPYQYHIWINASAKIISQNVSGLPKILTKSDNPQKYITDHEVLDVFDNPNPFMSSTGFWNAIVLGLMLPAKKGGKKDNTGGQVFLVCLASDGTPVNLRKGEVPDVIFPYTDQFIKPRKKQHPNGQLELEGWNYVDPTTEQTVLKLETSSIIRIYLFNPYDWLKGMSFYTPAQLALTEDIKSDIYNSQFFENDASVAGVLQSEMDLTPDQYEINYKRWYERHGGVGRNNTIAILGNGLKYQQFGISHVDMQFAEQKQFNFEKFAAAYGLNKIAYGKYESINFATIKEGRRILWQDTYAPLDRLITKSITDQFIKFIEKGLVFRSDYQFIEALQADYKKKVEAAAQMVRDMSYPASLASRINNIPLTDENIKEYPWLDEKPVKATVGVGMNPDKEKIKIIDEDSTDMSEDDKIKFSWDYIHRVLDPGEKKFKARLERFFNSQRNKMQDLVDEWLKKQKSCPEKMSKDVFLKVYWNQVEKQDEDDEGLILAASMFLLPIKPENEKLTKLVKPLVKEQMKREESKLKDELDELIEWSATDRRIDEYVKQRADIINEINRTTFEKSKKKVNEAIQKAIKDNMTPQQAAKLIKSAIGDTMTVRKNQAIKIARTEIGSISSAARYDAFKVEGFEYHRWLTAADERVRVNHQIAEEAGPIRIGDVFPAVLMRYPLDPRGAVSEIVNCRCVAIPVPTEEVHGA